MPLTITFGDFGVVITPSSATIDLDVSPTLQLGVTVTDGSGQSVSSPLVQWATTDPSRAQVDQQGNVTGLLFGAVDIVATYNGIAGVSHLTIENSGLATFFADADGDGWGDASSTIFAPGSEPAPEGYVGIVGDCNDSDALVNPDQLEPAGDTDGIDNDCDGVVDEVALVGDNDDDGFGDPAVQFEGAAGTAFAVPAGGSPDCNDSNATIFPGAPETAGDGIDQNCDGADDT